MTLDKNKNRRQELDNEIKKVEMKEDEFIQLKNRFERSLEEFQMNFRQLSYRNSELLENGVDVGSQQATNELEESQMLTRKVDEYVNSQLEEVSDASLTIRKSLDDKREQFIKERNNLPWE